MEKVITKDGSITLYNEDFKETYHSKSGALEEAFVKYSAQAGIKERAKKGSLAILDICFGLGYNSLAAIHDALQANPSCKLSIIALENDIKILQEISKITPPHHLQTSFNIIRSAAQNLIFGDNQISLRILLDDARKSIKTINESFDVVFLDPFSPPKNPELWTEDFFKDIRKLMNASSILVTYSCARKVRDNLKAAGFRVEDGAHVGRYAPSTLAFIQPSR